MSTMMLRTRSADRSALLQGTLDMLILRTLIFGPAHGHQIAKHIQQTTDDLLRLEHGSLYPALHRHERQGWVAAKWDVLGSQKRECKYYRLTPAGRKQLAAEESNWNKMAKAIARVMSAAPEKA
jgi:transcriptional regulator